MTIINNSLSNNTVIVSALLRLSTAILRQNNPYHSPPSDELLDMFVDLSGKDLESNTAAIKQLTSSGDLTKVSEEMYSPSSDIFDQNGIVAVVTAPPTVAEVSPIDFMGDDSIKCASHYTIKYNDEVYASIKNYHSLIEIDYSVTSRPYPVLVVESLQTYAFVFGGRLGSPITIESLDVISQAYSISYPYTVGYIETTMNVESINTLPNIYNISYPTTVVYGTYIYDESINSTGKIYAITYPTTVNYITYISPSEAINTQGHIYAAFFGT